MVLPALDLGKGVNFFLIKTLAKVDLVEGVTPMHGTTFVNINAVLEKVNVFFTRYKDRLVVDWLRICWRNEPVRHQQLVLKCQKTWKG